MQLYHKDKYLIFFFVIFVANFNCEANYYALFFAIDR